MSGGLSALTRIGLFAGPMGLAGLIALLPLAALADARLAGVFGDHMVLQRGQPIAVWGWAQPGEAVQVRLSGPATKATARTGTGTSPGSSTRAGPDGRWAVQLPALRATRADQALTLTVQARNTLVLNDVLVGDVWLCAGQSNMAWVLRDSQDAAQAIAEADLPAIRHLAIAHRASLRPMDDGPPATWEISHPERAGGFSAVAFHFARRMQRELGVPIGLVNVAWGGTHLETWTSPRAAHADADLAPWLRDLPVDDAAYPAWQQARAWAGVQRWQPGSSPQPAGSAAWAGPDTDHSGWKALNLPGLWEGQGLPGFDGEVWFRREVVLTEAQAAGAATLHLGAIDDCDETWVNGRRAGGLCVWDQPRHHALPPGVLHAGSNLIAVRVTDTGGGGGFHGEAAALQLETAAGSLPLAGPWHARVAAAAARPAPAANDLPTLAFNGMIQPLLPLRLRGVLWYQGESNVPRAAAYAGAMRRLVTDWRSLWQQPTLPFLYVQLAAFLPLASNTHTGSAWAELRDAQRQVLALPHTGMVVATDVGDANDIHPRNKRAIGDRLAGLALRDVFGRKLPADGPVLLSARQQPGQLELRLRPNGGALALRAGDDTLQGFSIADATRQFQPALARIQGDRILVSHPAMPHPLAVRYAWANNPQQANLVNQAGLPASPFRTDRWPLLTDGVVFSP